MGFWLGVAFLVACGLGVPVYRKFAHSAMLKHLGWEGASVIPVTWGLSGLRLRRARWEGEMEFEPAGVGGGGRRGHLRLIASLGRTTPSLLFREAGRPVAPGGEPTIPTGDAAFDAKIAVQGDAVLARKILSPDQRGRLLQFQESGGYLWAVSGGVVELGGPLPSDGAGLRAFLDQCDAILDAMVGAVSS
ncbi:MAG TPA: hypothetical protein VKW04_06905 [Planctomycetota bacterium]|jgi:hypothetical protein|nr:hypothetical protein [Planctomycetota bacterium]